MIPYKPPSFLEGCIVLSKLIDGKKTWKSCDGKRLYQWDSQHGDIEVYSAKMVCIWDAWIKWEILQNQR